MRFNLSGLTYMKTQLLKNVRAVGLGVMAVCSLTLVSCDELSGPFRETPVNPIDSSAGLRNILIEDFTGQKCGNCPIATDLAKQITDAYGSNRIITVAVHSGQFAVPDPTSGFPVDYRTEAGDALTNSFKIFANPMGMINRTKGTAGYGLETGKWSAEVTRMLKDTAEIGIKLQNSYNEATRTITIDAEIEYVKAGSPLYQIVGILTESKIIGDQLDYRLGDGEASHIKGYVFNHVLRASMNGTFGEPLSDTEVPAGTKITKKFVYTIPEGVSWIPENMDAVVYVHRHTTEAKAVREVLQAEHVHVK
jgi:hypothetical protein